MGMLFSLIGLVFLQCIHIPKYQVVYLMCIQYLCVKKATNKANVYYTVNGHFLLLNGDLRVVNVKVASFHSFSFFFFLNCIFLFQEIIYHQTKLFQKSSSLLPFFVGFSLLVHSFMHSFVHTTHSYWVPCAKHSTIKWGSIIEQRSLNPCLHRAFISEYGDRQ